MLTLAFPDCVHMKLCKYVNTWPARLSLKPVSIWAGEQLCRPVRGWKLGSSGIHSFAQLSDTGRIQLFGSASVKCPTHPRCWRGGRSEPRADPPDCRSHIYPSTYGLTWPSHETKCELITSLSDAGHPYMPPEYPSVHTWPLSGFIWSASHWWSI